MDLEQPSRKSRYLAAFLDGTLHPLSAVLPARGPLLWATRAVFAGLGSIGRLPSGVVARSASVGVEGVWFAYEQARAGEVLLYLHGGGFVWGSPRTYRMVAARLAKASGMNAFVPHYRRAPEFAYPCAGQDCLAAYRALLDHGIAPQDIRLAGDSAGGHLVAALLRDINRARLPMPGAAYLMSPFIDLTCESLRQADRDPFCSVNYADKCVAAYAPGPLDAAELDVVSTDKTGWPPILIHIGDTECMLVGAQRYAQSLADAGVPHQLHVWRGQVHIFPAFADIVPEGWLALHEAADFLRTRGAAG